MVVFGVSPAPAAISVNSTPRREGAGLAASALMIAPAGPCNT